MATESQINANRQNAAHSSGPATTTGKATSSRNALTFGLYTREDYFTFEEQDLYKEFCQTMYFELSPATLVEQSLTAEITGATWRLRRCSAVEGEIARTRRASEDGTARPYRHDDEPQSAAACQDPLLDERSEKTRRSIDRARASAHSLLHRSINQLRKIQTNRAVGFELSAKETPPAPTPKIPTIEEIRAAIEPPLEVIKAIDDQLESIRLTQMINSASFCKQRAAAPTPIVRKPEPPRNCPCPCGSGLKYKYCCLRTGPAWAASDVTKAA
jgi:hypothetical protein